MEVFDGFPGNRVPPETAYVDFRRAVLVGGVHQEKMWVLPRGGEQRTLPRWGRYVDVWFTAVRFTSNGGTTLWVNYARGDNQWMRVVWSPSIMHV